MIFNCKHDDLKAAFNFFSKKVAPLIDVPGKYSKILNLCKKSKKFGIISYEIDTVNDKAYCVIARVMSFKGVMLTKSRCVTFHD